MCVRAGSDADVEEVGVGLLTHRPGHTSHGSRNASIRAMGESHGESWGDSMTSMDFINSFIGNSMRESMTHYFHLRTSCIDLPIPLKKHGGSLG